MGKRWTGKEIEFLKKNYKNMSYRKIAKILGRSYVAIKAKARKLDLCKIRMWNDGEIKFLSDNYAIMPPIKISEYLGRGYASVIVKASCLGLKAGYRYYKPLYDEDFFAVSNWSRELSWMTGIVLSDGYVSNPNFGHFITIDMCDRDVIEKIRRITGCKKNIKKRMFEDKLRQDSYIIGFWGKKIWNFFSGLGFDNKKSYTAKFPIGISHKHVHHLIRGIFDGDGSISIRKNFYPFVTICGTESVVKTIAANVKIRHTIHCDKRSKANFMVAYSGKRALKFLEYIYKDSTINTRMDRKYNKYLDALKYKER